MCLCVVQYLVSYWKLSLWAEKLSVSSSGYFRLVSLWASFRCHALVKYSPDAFSFNYTHIVVWLYFNDFEVLPWETHSDVLFFFRRLFVSFQCTRFLWYLIKYHKNIYRIEWNAVDKFQLIYCIFMVILKWFKCSGSSKKR